MLTTTHRLPQHLRRVIQPPPLVCSGAQILFAKQRLTNTIIKAQARKYQNETQQTKKKTKYSKTNMNA
jgi:hypothetical protein